MGTQRASENVVYFIYKQYSTHRTCLKSLQGAPNISYDDVALYRTRYRMELKVCLVFVSQMEESYGVCRETSRVVLLSAKKRVQSPRVVFVLIRLV